MRWHRRNPEPEQRGLTKAERVQVKRYLFAKRFLEALPFSIVKCVAHKYGDEETLSLRSKSKMIEDLCSISEFVDSATKKGHGNSIKFALRKCLSPEDRQNLMGMMGISAKSSDMATINHIYETLKIGLQLPVSEIPSIREELSQLRKEDRKRKTASRRKKTPRRKKALRYSDVNLNEVVNYLLEAAKADYLGQKLTLLAYAKQKGLVYSTFAYHAKRLKDLAKKEAKEQFDRWVLTYEEPKYRQLVVEYLAEKEFFKAEKSLVPYKFADERGIDRSLFNYFLRKLSA